MVHAPLVAAETENGAKMHGGRCAAPPCIFLLCGIHESAAERES